MNKITVSLCIIVLLGFIVSCKPPTVLFHTTGGMVIEDISFPVGERVELAILRYQNKDTLQYLFDHYAALGYPREIQCPYVCYMPKEQTGVLGVHAGKRITPPLYGKSILPLSELRNPNDMESANVYYLPLYRYQISDTVISFRKMTRDEQIVDTTQISSTVYAKGKWLISHSYYTSFDAEFMPEVKTIFDHLHNISYQYLNGSDTILQYDAGLNFGDKAIASIPMFHLPLTANIYYKKHLVKKRNGFQPGGPSIDKLADYRNEIDTAQLALPVRIFQEQYIQTNDIYCLDGLSVPFKRD